MSELRTSWLVRIAFYVIGLLILAFGVSISVLSGLGVSPVSSIPYVLSEALQIELGNMTIIVFSVYVLIQVFILRKNFKMFQLLQIICAIIFGKFVTLTTSLLSGCGPHSYFEKLLMIIVSTVMIALGIHIYLLAKIVPQSGEGLVQTIAEKGGWKLADVKNLFDLLSVLVASLVSLLAFGKIVGLREGTVIAAIGVGRVLMLLSKVDNGRLHQLLYGVSNMKRRTSS